MKIVIFSLLVAFSFSGSVLAGEITEKEVLTLVQSTCVDIANANNPETEVLSQITAGKHPYRHKDKPSLYVFIYSPEVNIVAHPKRSLVGRNFKGKPDVKGKKFRDIIVSKALKNKEGWEAYYYQKPGHKGIFLKKAHFKLCEKNKKQYIVVSGLYLDKL